MILSLFTVGYAENDTVDCGNVVLCFFGSDDDVNGRADECGEFYGCLESRSYE